MSHSRVYTDLDRRESVLFDAARQGEPKATLGVATHAYVLGGGESQWCHLAPVLSHGAPKSQPLAPCE